MQKIIINKQNSVLCQCSLGRWDFRLCSQSVVPPETLEYRGGGKGSGVDAYREITFNQNRKLVSECVRYTSRRRLTAAATRQRVWLIYYNIIYMYKQGYGRRARRNFGRSSRCRVGPAGTTNVFTASAIGSRKLFHRSSHYGKNGTFGRPKRLKYSANRLRHN